MIETLNDQTIVETNAAPKPTLQLESITGHLGLVSFLLRILTLDLMLLIGLICLLMISMLSRVDGALFTAVNGIIPPVLLLFVVMKIVLSIYAAMRWSSVSYEFRPGVIIYRYGVFRTRERTITLEEAIESRLTKRLLDKIFGSGNILIRFVRTDEDFRIVGIQNAEFYHKFLSEYIYNKTNSTA